MIIFHKVSLRQEGKQTGLSDVSFHIRQGTFTYFLGSSGSGKSLALKLIATDLLPDQGVISVLNRNTRELSLSERHKLRRSLGLIFQEGKLLSHLSVYENVTLPLVVRRAPEGYEADIYDLLNWVGLRDKVDTMPGDLSEGERQRVMIARAVITKPALLLADEPISVQDRPMAMRLMNLLVELNRRGTTMILATNDQSLAESHPAPSLYFQKGQLLPSSYDHNSDETSALFHR